MKRMINICLIAALVVSMSVAMVGCGETETLSIDTNNYVRYSFSGYDGEGTASIVFDESSFKDEFDGKLEYLGKDKNDDTPAIDEFITEIEGCGNIDKTENLSNGDIITLSWNIDDNYMESKYNVLLSYEDIELTVEGLEELEIEIRIITDPSEIGVDADELGGVILADYFDENIVTTPINVDEDELQNYAETCGDIIFDGGTSDSLGNITFFVNTSQYFTLYTWYCDMDYSDLAYLKMVRYDGSEKNAWDSVRELMIQYSILGDRFLNLEYDENYHCVFILLNEQNTSLILMASCNGEIVYDATEDETMQISENAKASDITTWNGNESSGATTSEEPAISDEQTLTSDPVVSEDPTPSTDQNESEEQTPIESSTPANTATSGESNALDRAKSYLKHQNFSYSGLIDQLEYEGYSEEEATYGADNCGADWNEQALEKAKSYLKHQNFSYSGLIEQLEFEGFTSDQAVYGVNNCGADWNEQAVKKAESYISRRSYTHEDLIGQLEYEGFTPEQAEYGASQVGV